VKRVRKEFSRRNPAYKHYSQKAINKVKRELAAAIKILEELLTQERKSAKSKPIVAPLTSIVSPDALPDDDARRAAGYIQQWKSGIPETLYTEKIPSPEFYISDDDIRAYANDVWKERKRTLFENEVIRRAIQVDIFQPTKDSQNIYLSKRSKVGDEFPDIFGDAVIDYAGFRKRRVNINDYYVEQDPEEGGKEKRLILKTQGASIGLTVRGPGWRQKGTGENTRLVARAVESFDDLGPVGNGGNIGDAGADSEGSWLSDLDSGEVGSDN
jgi:hypothetical protein